MNSVLNVDGPGKRGIEMFSFLAVPSPKCFSFTSVVGHFLQLGKKNIWKKRGASFLSKRSLPFFRMALGDRSNLLIPRSKELLFLLILHDWWHLSMWGTFPFLVGHLESGGMNGLMKFSGNTRFTSNQQNPGVSKDLQVAKL